MTNNTILNFSANFYLTADTKEQYNHTIDQTNTVNGKPIYHLYGIHDQLYEGLDIGDVIIADAENIT